MKRKMLMLCLIAFFITCQSYNSYSETNKTKNQNKIILGKWKITKQTCQFLKSVSKNDIIIFKNNGKLKLISKNKRLKQKNITGSWKFINKDLKIAFNTDNAGKNTLQKDEIIGKIVNSKANYFKMKFRCNGMSFICIAPRTDSLILELKKL